MWYVSIDGVGMNKPINRYHEDDARFVPLLLYIVQCIYTMYSSIHLPLYTLSLNSPVLTAITAWAYAFVASTRASSPRERCYCLCSSSDKRRSSASRATAIRVAMASDFDAQRVCITSALQMDALRYRVDLVRQCLPPPPSLS